MSCRVVLVRADVSEERIASIIKVEVISKLVTIIEVTINRKSVPKNASFASHC
jgi:hypothetical protein